MTPPTSRFRALGTTAVVMTTEADALASVIRAVSREIDAVDAACSRFRPDSELVRLNAAAGCPVVVSPLLLEAVAVACRAAVVTGGIVDPTVGSSMRALGYDRDFRSVPPEGPPLHVKVRGVAGWRRIEVSEVAGTVRIDEGVELDLGATAKALAVDRAVAAALAETAAGVLVSIGGDLAVGGPTWPGGWSVHVDDDHAADPSGPGPCVVIGEGALATSGTTVRRWQRGTAVLHHVVDPRSGAPAPVHWRTATVAAASCVDANIASTAAIVLGADAAGWLEERNLPARLVRADGAVTVVGGWPHDERRSGETDDTRLVGSVQRPPPENWASVPVTATHIAAQFRAGHAEAGT
ncbi:MAG TPA: FAD:protein FMN transferase [Acidimicrobiales bacterium]|nr:FAD:protein FMN transferase [Acidimicrobiales bacterium]